MTTHYERATGPTVTDAAITAMFDRRARRADGRDLRAPILTATLSQEQHGAWRLRLRTALRPGWVRGLVLIVLAGMMAALALAGIGALRNDRPLKATTTDFVLPFEYLLPTESGMRPAPGGPHSEIIAWIDGPNLHPPGSGDDLYGGQRPETGNRRGIIVAAAKTAWSHSDSGRFFLRMAPADFLTDLETPGNVAMSPIADTMLDGRPALTATLMPFVHNDVHVNREITGLAGGSGFVLLNGPARLTVADVGGTTVFVLVWARTTEDLDAWKPVSDAFVSSIHFLPKTSP